MNYQFSTILSYNKKKWILLLLGWCIAWFQTNILIPNILYQYISFEKILIGRHHPSSSCLYIFFLCRIHGSFIGGRSLFVSKIPDPLYNNPKSNWLFEKIFLIISKPFLLHFAFFLRIFLTFVGTIIHVYFH